MDNYCGSPSTMDRGEAKAMPSINGTALKYAVQKTFDARKDYKDAEVRERVTIALIQGGMIHPGPSLIAEAEKLVQYIKSGVKP